MTRLTLTGILLFTATFSTYADTPIRIGVIQSLSGMAQEDGTYVVRAMQIAADDINAEHTGSVELLVEDDASIAKNTATAYQKLRGQGVDAIVAGTWSFLAQVLQPLAQRDRMVVFNTSNFPEMFTFDDQAGYFFSNVSSLESDARVLSRFLQRKKYQKAMIVSTETAWGAAQVKRYRGSLQEQGIKLAGEEVSTQIDGSDWREIIPRIQRMQPDLILLPLAARDIDGFVRRARESGVTADFFGSTHGYEAFHLSGQKNSFEGLCFTYPYVQLHRDARFVSEFQKRFQREPRLYSDHSYDSVGTLVTAVREARRTKSELRNILKQQVFRGIVGEYRFQPGLSLAAGESSLLCVQGGKTVVQ